VREEGREGWVGERVGEGGRESRKHFIVRCLLEVERERQRKREREKAREKREKECV
jgi:hypothetical protein